MQRLAEDAEKAGLDQKSPFKEQLEIYRMQVLVHRRAVERGEQHHAGHRRRRAEVLQGQSRQVQGSQSSGHLYRLQSHARLRPRPTARSCPLKAEAKAKIEDLAKQIQGGADFGKLARENSDDKASAAKDGDFGVDQAGQRLSASKSKTAVFALKQGEISAPIKQPNGFYLIRAEEINQQSFNDAIFKLFQTVRQAKFQEWLKGMQAQYNVKIENPAYFAPRVPAQLQQVH